MMPNLGLTLLGLGSSKPVPLSETSGSTFVPGVTTKVDGSSGPLGRATS